MLDFLSSSVFPFLAEKYYKMNFFDLKTPKKLKILQKTPKLLIIFWKPAKYLVKPQEILKNFPKKLRKFEKFWKLVNKSMGEGVSILASRQKSSTVEILLVLAMITSWTPPSRPGHVDPSNSLKKLILLFISFHSYCTVLLTIVFHFINDF